MAWPFRCASPDFTARSILDDVTFGVKRQCLVDGSELFGARAEKKRGGRLTLRQGTCSRTVRTRIR
jgi:hypothetical protein